MICLPSPNSLSQFPSFWLWALPLDEGKMFSYQLVQRKPLMFDIVADSVLLCSLDLNRDIAVPEGSQSTACRVELLSYSPEMETTREARLHWENASPSVGTEECLRKDFMISINKCVCVLWIRIYVFMLWKCFKTSGWKVLLRFSLGALPEIIYHFTCRTWWVRVSSGSHTVLGSSIFIV